MNKIREEQRASLPYCLQDAISVLQSCLDKIPEKYKKDVFITVDEDEVYISYFRDETEDEKAAREYREKNSSSILEARERKELERLLEKYGDNIPDPVL